MKTFNLALLASLFLINILFLQTPEESPELKQATDLTQFAVSLFNEKKYDEALSLVKKGLEIRERLLPRSDMRISISLIYLGDLYIAKRDYSAAKKVLERLLEIQAERSGPEDVSLAPTLDRLGVIYDREGESRKAEELYTRALASREKAYGAENVRVAESLLALAQFYRSERDSERSASYYVRSLKIYGKLLGVASGEFERASDGYSCLAHESRRPELLEELNWIRKLLAPSPTSGVVNESRVLNGMAISLPKPAYPDAARDRRLSGFVIVKVLIDESGKVVKAQDMCGGPPYLTESAIKAAMKARFTPTKLSGMPVKVNGVIQYNFVAQFSR